MISPSRCIYFSFIYLTFLGAFTWGYLVAFDKVWPSTHIKKFLATIEEFEKGDEEEKKTTVVQKIVSDEGGKPHRNITEDPMPLILKNAAFIKTPTMKEKGPRLHIAANKPLDGYLLVSGIFHDNGSGKNMLMAMDMQGNVLRQWTIPSRMDPGLTINEEGDIFHVSPPGNSISKGIVIQDWCGTKENLLLKNAHHAVEFAPDGTLWTLHDHHLIQLDVSKPYDKKLSVVNKISLYDVFEKNDVNNTLSQRFDFKYLNKQMTKATYKPQHDQGYHFHHNDVQPFIDPRFTTKSGYALLVSVRNLQLVLILDPDTRKILWWSQGDTYFQHDVDYYKGHAYVYDNRLVRDWSHIARLDFDAPPGKARKTIIDGKIANWHEPYWGSHQIFEVNNKPHYLVTSNRAGKLFIVDDKQSVIFELENRYSKNEVLFLWSAIWIDKKKVKRWEARCKPIGGSTHAGQ